MCVFECQCLHARVPMYHGMCVQVKGQLLGACPPFLLRQTAIQVSCLTNFEVLLLPPPPISQWEYWDCVCHHTQIFLSGLQRLNLDHQGCAAIAFTC